MLPLLVHYCKNCSYNTPVPFSASAFSQNTSCSHCGALSRGVNVRGKEDTGEMGDMQQDELAGLFDRTLVLSQQQHSQQEPQQIREQYLEEHQPQPHQPVIYSSQHYTHSSHVKPRATSEPPRTAIDRSEIHSILLRHSIDPSLLYPSQINLFQHADDDQRLRLLELWRISPPNYVTSELAEELSAANITSLQKEEAMARIRYERHLQQQPPSAILTPDGNADEDMVTDQPLGEASFSPATQSPSSVATDPKTAVSTAEPYILSGYEYLAQRDYERSAHQQGLLTESTRHNQATDPVYNKQDGGNQLWRKPEDLQDMENNYGAFEQMRDYGAQRGDMEAFVGMYGLDEDMMM